MLENEIHIFLEKRKKIVTLSWIIGYKSPKDIRKKKYVHS